MPTEEEIKAEKTRLYETEGVRDDLNDAEATVLLQWAETRIDAIAQKTGDFEQMNRFLRQLLARIDRFVGQRAFLDDAGQAEHIDNLMKILPIAGYETITREQVTRALPTDKADMSANLQAILGLLTPQQAAPKVSPFTDAPLDDVPVPETSAIPAPKETEEDDASDPLNPLKGLIRQLRNLGTPRDE